MSTAVFPLGMNSMPASGYNHKSTFYNKEYSSWKGTGINSFPIGTAPSHIRPLTNNDPGNIFQTGFGLPRPIKHYRKGRVVPPTSIADTNPVQINNFLVDESGLINYNLNRYVESSKGSSLGGGFGGSGLISELIDKPGAYSVKENNVVNNTIDNSCKTCEGAPVVVNYKPNNFNLQNNPAPNTTNPVWCCNEEKKARRRTVYASTNLNKNYYTTNKQYLQNRCQTYEQKAFNFLSYRTNSPSDNAYYYSTNNLTYKPGAPNSIDNTYLANCQLNAQLYESTELAFIYKVLAIYLEQNIISQETYQQFISSGINTIDGFFNWILGLDNKKEEALIIFKMFISNPYWGMPPSGPTNPTTCQLTVYKPNNFQYACQGAVESSTRMLKLNESTVSTSAFKNKNVIKTKTNGDGCNTPWPLNFPQSKRFQNKKFCSYKSMPEYQNIVSQPSPYRYFVSTVFNSNHFSQSPNTYNSVSR